MNDYEERKRLLEAIRREHARDTRGMVAAITATIICLLILLGSVLANQWLG